MESTALATGLTLDANRGLRPDRQSLGGDGFLAEAAIPVIAALDGGQGGFRLLQPHFDAVAVGLGHLLLLDRVDSGDAPEGGLVELDCFRAVIGGRQGLVELLLESEELPAKVVELFCRQVITHRKNLASRGRAVDRLKGAA